MSLKETEDRALPPRSKLHPSEKGKWTRRFYLSLVFLFIALIVSMIGLFYWKLR